MSSKYELAVLTKEFFELRGRVEKLERKVYDLENPIRYTDQNIGIRGNEIYFNGNVLALKPHPEMVNAIRYKENDKVENAEVSGNDIIVTMKSGDVFRVINYYNTKNIKVERETV